MRDNPNPAPPGAATPVQSNSVIGRTFGRLTVISFVCFRSKRAYFKCRCACGRPRVASSAKLKSGTVRACRDCARRPAIEKARRLANVPAAEIVANWRDYYNAFTPKQRAAYFRHTAERRAAGAKITDLVRAAAVVEVLRVWVGRTLAHAGEGVS